MFDFAVHRYREWNIHLTAREPEFETPMLLIVLIVLVVLWTPGYYGYGRNRWNLGYGGHALTTILVIVLILALLGRI